MARYLYEEGPISNSPFSSTYGLLTIDGIPKAAATAFRFLERLRGPSLGLEQLTWQAIGSPVDLSPGKAFLGDFFTDCAHGPMGKSCAAQIPAKYFTVPDSNGAMRARADKYGMISEVAGTSGAAFVRPLFDKMLAHAHPTALEWG